MKILKAILLSAVLLTTWASRPAPAPAKEETKMAEFQNIGPCVNAAQAYQALVTRDRKTGREFI